ncbi:MAG: TrmH family RNA methyltransferase, partial [Candidatus Saccharimonadales bacterium]
EKDTRLPHVVEGATRKIAITALGAEQTVPFEHSKSIKNLTTSLKKEGTVIYALEQAEGSKPLEEIRLTSAAVLILGNEVQGLSQTELKLADQIIEIPMRGKKESFNVAVAAAIAAYKLLN